MYVNLPLCSPPGCGDGPVKVFVFATPTALSGLGERTGGAGGAELPKQTGPYKETSLKLGPKFQIHFFLQRTEPNTAARAVINCFINLVPFVSDLLKGEWHSEMD